MADNYQPPVTQPLPEQPLVEPPQPVVQPPKKSKKWIWVVVGISLSALCLCAVAVAVFIVYGAKQVTIERSPIESILDQYMQAMANKDAEGAYALFSPRAQRQIPISDLQMWITGNNYLLFEGYQSLSVDQLKINAAVNLDPDAPQGTVAVVSGTTSYSGGFKGTFSGTLEKVNRKWMIDGIFTYVSPDKIQP